MYICMFVAGGNAKRIYIYTCEQQRFFVLDASTLRFEVSVW